MQIGIFGGTFDPIHLAHLIVAEQAREQARLDQVRFIPSARPPHKDTGEITPFERRVEMLRLALAGRTDFVIDTIEHERSGPSYTADTLALLRERLGEEELSLIIGSDCLPDLAGWHEPMRIIAQTKLLVVARPGVEVWEHARLASELELSDPSVLRMKVIESPLISFASTDLRRRVAEGRTIRYLVPRAVEEYIREKNLYHSPESTRGD